MARQISLQGIDAKIAKAGEHVLRIKASYDNALHELEALRHEVEEKEIIRAVRSSGKSFQEIMRLLRLYPQRPRLFIGLIIN